MGACEVVCAGVEHFNRADIERLVFQRGHFAPLRVLRQRGLPVPDAHLAGVRDQSTARPSRL